MRVAALFDVHGNLPALEAVLGEVGGEEVDVVVSGGDLVWGPFPGECLERLRAVRARFIRGNADREALEGEREIGRFSARRLDEAQRALVASWPLTLELDVTGVGRVLFCHATPRADDEILTRDTPEAAVRAALAGVSADLVVCGHTHVQLDRRVAGAPRVVNAGSVGMPYEGDPAARWLLLGPGVELRRTAYDAEAAIAQIVATGLPRAEVVVSPLRGEVSTEDAIRFFESRRGA